MRLLFPDGTEFEFSRDVSFSEARGGFFMRKVGCEEGLRGAKLKPWSRHTFQGADYQVDKQF